MNYRKSNRTILFCASIVCFNWLFLSTDGIRGQNRIKTEKEPVWFTKLYEENVKYEDFSCSTEFVQTVSNHFKKHPLDKRISIYHNNCPIVKCKPVIPFPATAAAVRVTGEAAVHILVDENGKVLFARFLTGHSLISGAVSSLLNAV